MSEDNVFSAVFICSSWLIGWYFEWYWPLVIKGSKKSVKFLKKIRDKKCRHKPVGVMIGFSSPDRSAIMRCLKCNRLIVNKNIKCTSGMLIALYGQEKFRANFIKAWKKSHESGLQYLQNFSKDE